VRSEMAFADGNLRTIADRACNGVLPMLMSGETKTTAGEAYDNRKYADGAGADEDFIVIEADTKADRCYFLFSIFVRVCLM
jgi:hypothetical protein